MTQEEQRQYAREGHKEITDTEPNEDVLDCLEKYCDTMYSDLVLYGFNKLNK